MIIDFLKTATTTQDLKIALKVLREFKDHESKPEWAYTPFSEWVKLEELHEFLEHLVEGKALREDTLIRLQEVNAKGVKPGDMLKAGDEALEKAKGYLEMMGATGKVPESFKEIIKMAEAMSEVTHRLKDKEDEDEEVKH